MSWKPGVAGLTLVVGLAGALAGPPVQAAEVIEICRISTSELDLNGDGYDDAVVGDPYAEVNGRAAAGAVVILYGDADRRIGEGRRLVITQATVSGSAAEAGDHFGWSVAMHDIDRDGCADLLVGSPGEDWAGQADAGITHLISWTPDGRGGPGTARTKVFDQGDVAGTVEAGDRFGHAVAMGGGGDETAAMGAPGEDVGSVVDAGAVSSTVLDGEQWTGSEERSQGRGLPGTPEPGDRLGSAVLVAPLWVSDSTGDTAIDVTIVAGAPGDTVARGGVDQKGAGSLSAWNDVSGYEQVVTQESPGVPGAAEAGDAFGASLAFSEPRTTQEERILREVAVGSPGEDLGSTQDAGAVTVLPSVRTEGLRGGPPALTQNTAGFAGHAEAGDRFGHSVTFWPGRFAGATLVVGAPYEDIGTVRDAGLVQVAILSGQERAAQAVTAYSENTAGTPGRVAAGSRFGLSVTGMRGLAETVIAVSSPYQGAGSVFVASNHETVRSWVPGRGGIPASSGRFGWSVAGLQFQPR